MRTGRKSLQKVLAKAFLKSLGAAAVLAPGIAAAQVTGDCGGWKTDARNIAEPWEENTATFANGRIRVAVIDATEPGAMPLFLMVLTPPYDELGARTCVLIASEAEGIGFPALSLAGMEQGYDPATGLTLSIPSARWSGDMTETRPARLVVTIDQSTGQVAARLE